MMAIFTTVGVILGIVGVVYMTYSLCRPEKF
ncbi:hypothetical protein Tam10B_2314 [Bifidobacterium vansinderenii]|uniref:Potassium-transporting ATPase subunit F n=1 Tax=Bifidobacterium vansinderenii TaxID=1984871 RepID=A0A229VVC7_9BIFI|nr:hypothetical protein Tam10B_2314 [Bifidobacterium vansinderenii]